MQCKTFYSIPMEEKVMKRRQRKAASVEKIYRTAVDDEKKIFSHQKIAELITLTRAEYMGITFEEGEKFYEHPELKDFYQSLWGDISNAIRRFGGRNVIAAIELNKWICNNKYGDKPLRIKKFIEAATKLLETTGRDDKVELPKNPTKETPKRRQY